MSDVCQENTGGHPQEGEAGSEAAAQQSGAVRDQQPGLRPLHAAPARGGPARHRGPVTPSLARVFLPGPSCVGVEPGGGSPPQSLHLRPPPLSDRTDLVRPGSQGWTPGNYTVSTLQWAGTLLNINQHWAGLHLATEVTVAGLTSHWDSGLINIIPRQTDLLHSSPHLCSNPFSDLQL